MFQYEEIAWIYESIDIYDVFILSTPFLLFYANRLSTQLIGVKAKMVKLLGLLICFLSPAIKNPIASKEYLFSCLILLAIFVILLILDRNIASSTFIQKLGLVIKKQFIEYPSFYGSLLIVIFLSPPLFRAFDLTDAGYWMSQSLLNFRQGIYGPDISNTYFLSSFISGALISLLNFLNIGLVGVRIIWLILFIFPIALTTYIVSNLILRHWLLPFIALATALNISVYSKVPDYELVPSCLAALFVYFFIISFKLNPIFSVSSGFVFGLLVLARIPAAVVGVLFMMPPIFLFNQSKSKYLKTLTLQFLGLTSCILLFLVFLNQTNSIDSYFSIKNGTGIHSSKKFLDIVLLQLSEYYWSPSLILMALFFLTVFFSKKILQPDLFIIIIFYLIVMPGYLAWNTNPYIPYFLPTLLGTFFILYFFKDYWVLTPSHERLGTLTIAFAAIIMPWSLMIGSYSGLTKLSNGVWLLIPVAHVLMLKGAIYTTNRPLSKNIVILVIMSILIIAASGFRTYHRYPYGDHYDRTKMTAIFSNKKLAGIQTTPGRVKSFEGILKAIEINKSKNGMLFAYNNLPMIYYASDMDPLFDIVWITNYSLTFVAEIANKICTTTNFSPDLIVRTKVETRSGNWGENEIGPPIEEDIVLAKSKMNILDVGIQKCRGQILWENRDFQLIRPTIIF